MAYVFYAVAAAMAAANIFGIAAFSWLVIALIALAPVLAAVTVMVGAAAVMYWSSSK